jgi:phosphatidylserine decarboxylase
MVRDGYYFVIPLVGVASIAYFLDWWLIAVLSLILAAFVAFFFRNPQREIPTDPMAVVSPADGRVLRLTPENDGTQLSIFLSVLDVHVNRAPVDGTIVRQEYRPGRFHLAFDDRASVENERMIFTIGDDRRLTFSLVAGLLARRIVAWKKEGDLVTKGDRIALIRFGSRVDITLPSECHPAVNEGDRVRAGSSIIAHWRSGEEDCEKGRAGTAKSETES